MKVLLTVHEGFPAPGEVDEILPVGEVVDGKLYKFPAGEAVEIERDFDAGKCLEHLWHAGLVEVVVSKTTDSKGRVTGTTLMLDDAIERSTKAVVASETKLVELYIRTQQEDRLRKNFPAMPPEGRVKGIIARRKIDLTKFGITNFSERVSTAEAKLSHQQITLESPLAEENTFLRNIVKGVNARLELLEDELAKAKAAAAGAQTPNPAAVVTEVPNPALVGDDAGVENEVAESGGADPEDLLAAPQGQTIEGSSETSDQTVDAPVGDGTGQTTVVERMARRSRKT